MKPNKTRLRLWVKGLRSERWEQGYHELAPTTTTRCPLGVACEVYNEEPACKGHVTRLRFVGQYALPLRVQRWFGIQSSNPRLSGITVGTMNDHDGKSFDQIAVAIEQEFDL